VLQLASATELQLAAAADCCCFTAYKLQRHLDAQQAENKQRLDEVQQLRAALQQAS
jgi:hypothetical protein